MKVNPVLQSYGNISEYYRAIFSIWSFYAYRSEPFELSLIGMFKEATKISHLK